MTSFKIEVRCNADWQPDDPCGIRISAGSTVLTRLLRERGTEPDDHVWAPPYQLAFWVIDNWWRLRFESVPSNGMSAEWRLSHELSSIGGGFGWPKLAMWGEGEHIGVSMRADPAGVAGPVMYLDNVLLFVSADLWEAEIDRFLISQIESRLGSDVDALRTQFEALNSERTDKATAQWRRLEAKLGFDVDDAPEALVERLLILTEQYDHESIEEAVLASPGERALEIITAELEAAKTSKLTCEFGSAIRAIGQTVRRDEETPWRFAEDAAAKLRAETNLPSGRLGNRMLAEILGTTVSALETTKSTSSNELHYGLRLASQKSPGKHLVALRSRYSHDRRFELARALGDVVWSGSSHLGPIARSKTDRQKFQRAFAQSLLCPFDDLMEFIGHAEVDDELIMAAAHHFHVNTRMVETTLVKKGVLPVSRFEDMLEVA